ncbi:hypothetical protein RRG08_051237 [Elysia crispata]|uniref:Uncharacterized protein n=1 Tax=Elysia crispata TaxID=231223 RepID=A0AAE0ZSC8_9GAST|nr:hypothetical protein RRG08_051237 [Elysia crispata]
MFQPTKAKKFLYPGTRVFDLFEAYQKDAQNNKKKMFGLSFFRNHFITNSFSVFVPKKDQCNICIKFKHGGVDVEDHKINKHVTNKNQARESKASDKNDEDPNHSVWTAGLQANLVSPKTNANAMYYKTELQVHNLTLYDLKNKNGYCYVWDETEGDLSSDMFAHIFYQHFKKILAGNPHLSTITIWNDSCGYQNRCTAVANMYYHLPLEMNVKVFQKCSVTLRWNVTQFTAQLKGHLQNFRLYSA